MKVEEKFQRGGEKFQRDGEGSLISLLCSRNARSRTPLVGRAQWETDSGCPPGGDSREREGALEWSFDAGIQRSTRAQSSEIPGALASGGKKMSRNGRTIIIVVSSQTILLARKASTMGRWSIHARTMGPGHLVLQWALQ